MKPATGLSWLVEDSGVTLLRRDRGIHLSIPYPWAGLWALIANGNYTMETACDLMAVLQSISKAEAEDRIRNTLEAWVRQGLLKED